jgi:hypothetical protein
LKEVKIEMAKWKSREKFIKANKQGAVNFECERPLAAVFFYVIHSSIIAN